MVGVFVWCVGGVWSVEWCWFLLGKGVYCSWCGWCVVLKVLWCFGCDWFFFVFCVWVLGE